MPFKKGDPNINRNGRPKGTFGSLTSLLKDKLEEVPEGKKEAYKDLFVKTLLHKALIEKDLQSMKMIMNYVDGLPKQDISLSGDINLMFDNIFNSGENGTSNSTSETEADNSL